MFMTTSFVLSGRKRRRDGTHDAEHNVAHDVVRNVEHNAARNVNHPLEYTAHLGYARRERCIAYMHDTLDSLKASLQTLELASSLFDRYMSTRAPDLPNDRLELETLCLACVSLGTKVHEVDEFWEYDKDEAVRVAAMERRVTHALKWRLMVKDSLVERVFENCTTDGGKVVERAFQGLWQSARLLQEYDQDSLVAAMAKIVQSPRAALRDRCAQDILQRINRA